MAPTIKPKNGSVSERLRAIDNQHWLFGLYVGLAVFVLWAVLAASPTQGVLIGVLAAAKFAFLSHWRKQSLRVRSQQDDARAAWAVKVDGEVIVPLSDATYASILMERDDAALLVRQLWNCLLVVVHAIEDMWRTIPGGCVLGEQWRGCVLSPIALR